MENIEMNKQNPTAPVAEIKGAIRNPANPNHFMVVLPVDRRVQIHIGGVQVVDTASALRVIEIGKHAYQPRLYIPAADVTAELSRTGKTTHCPLKGEAAYYALDGAEVAWRYDTFDFAAILEGHLSFMAEGLSITEGA
ncbi:MAG: DUF427 domain-containing protein [Hyphomicrobiales bacterium]